MATKAAQGILDNACMMFRPSQQASGQADDLTLIKHS